MPEDSIDESCFLAFLRTEGFDEPHPKDVQGQMRHSRISTTMDIYAQFVPESARRAMDKTREMVERRQAAMQRLASEAVQ